MVAPSTSSLKDRNTKPLYSLLVLNGVLFWALAHQGDILARDWPKLANGWMAALPLAGVALTGLLNSVISADMKARMVFLRWHHPLPGSAAFTKLGPRSDRVDMAALQAKFGPLPTSPKQQNLLWYKMFKAVESNPGIEGSHRHFLLARDYAALLVIMLLVMGTMAAVFIRPWSSVGIFIALVLVQWAVAMRAANNGGHGLVINVLALQATTP